MNNRKTVFLAAVLAAVLLLPGCGKAVREPEQQEISGGKLKVAATLFPYYDFVRQVAGDRVELSLVIPAGMDSHSFEPTPADMRLIQAADLLICNGGGMETWVDEVLDAVDTRGMKVLTMMDYVDAVQEEIVEGMEDEEHDHSHEHGEHPSEETASGILAQEQETVRDYVDHDGHEQEIEYDEHVWTSPVNAMRFVEVIRDELTALDPLHAQEYAANADAYRKELEEIDAGFRAVSDARVRSLIVVGDKFPFRYLADEYRLDYRAAFSGCSTDTEPSARTIAYLIEKIRENGIPVIYYPELSSHRVSEVIAEETGARPLLLHSCHNVTRAEFASGVTYAQLMRQNIENLRKGLDE